MTPLDYILVAIIIIETVVGMNLSLKLNHARRAFELASIVSIEQGKVIDLYKKELAKFRSENNSYMKITPYEVAFENAKRGDKNAD